MRTTSFLEYELGVVSANRALQVSSSLGGLLEDRLGFPGAEQYLLEHLSRLGPYLSTIASHQVH